MVIAKHKSTFFKAIAVSVIGLILLCGRIWLLRQGGYADDTDVYPFLFIRVMYNDLLDFNLHTWTDTLFVTIGSYTDTAIRFIQTYILSMLHPDEENLYLTSYDIFRHIGYFNVAVSAAILLSFGGILKRLEFGFGLALLGVVLFGTMVHANIYVRHILPYDHSLLLHFVAIYILLARRVGVVHLLAAGLLSAISLTNYYGYYMMFLVQALLVLTRQLPGWKQAVTKSFIFLTPAICLIALFEVLCQLDGRSYIGFIREFSTTVFHGSFNETLIYILVYTFLVERWWGLLLLLLFIPGIVMAMKHREQREAKILIILGVAAYLVHGTYGYFFDGMVFYGRVVRMYFPFIIIGILFFIRYQKVIKKQILVVTLTLLSLVQYGFSLHDLDQIGYPLSMINEERLFEKENETVISYQHELACGIDYVNGGGAFFTTPLETALPPGNYTLVNFCFFYHYPDSFMDSYRKFEVPEDYEVIQKKTHFMSYPAYTLEYCTREGRQFFLEKDLQLMVLRQK